MQNVPNFARTPALIQLSTLMSIPKQNRDLQAPSRPNIACGTLNHTQLFTVVIVGREIRNDTLCTTVPSKIKLKAGI